MNKVKDFYYNKNGLNKSEEKIIHDCLLNLNTHSRKYIENIKNFDEWAYENNLTKKEIELLNDEFNLYYYGSQLRYDDPTFSGSQLDTLLISYYGDIVVIAKWNSDDIKDAYVITL